MKRHVKKNRRELAAGTNFISSVPFYNEYDDFSPFTFSFYLTKPIRGGELVN
jgi:hypothetical protein